MWWRGSHPPTSTSPLWDCQSDQSRHFDLISTCPWQMPVGAAHREEKTNENIRKKVSVKLFYCRPPIAQTSDSYEIWVFHRQITMKNSGRPPFFMSYYFCNLQLVQIYCRSALPRTLYFSFFLHLTVTPLWNPLRQSFTLRFKSAAKLLR